MRAFRLEQPPASKRDLVMLESDTWHCLCLLHACSRWVQHLSDSAQTSGLRWLQVPKITGGGLAGFTFWPGSSFLRNFDNGYWQDRDVVYRPSACPSQRHTLKFALRKGLNKRLELLAESCASLAKGVPSRPPAKASAAASLDRMWTLSHAARLCAISVLNLPSFARAYTGCTAAVSHSSSSCQSGAM